MPWTPLEEGGAKILCDLALYSAYREKNLGKTDVEYIIVVSKNKKTGFVVLIFI